MRLRHTFKSPGLLTAIIIILLSSGGGGNDGNIDNSGSAGSTQDITLSSLAQSGSSAIFNALLLERSQSLLNISVVLLHGLGGNPSLSTNDCHKLVGLKGTSTSPLETAVSDCIADL